MESSVSPQLDSSLNDSVSDGEENQSEDSPSPADPQVRHIVIKGSAIKLTEKGIRFTSTLGC